jgi:CubicO group peptidase (beta-lactamase class C family)
MALLIAAATLASCSSGSGGADRANGATTAATTATTSAGPPTTHGGSVPGASWDRVAPAAVGLDAEALGRSAATAEKGKSKCLVVIRDGSIAGEWNFEGTTPTDTQNIFSVTKSITSVLVGIAQDDGDLSIDDKAAKWIPEWRGTAAGQVTVRDLLSMDSGREWSIGTDYSELVKAKDQTAFAIGLSQAHAPGEQWAYNNSGVQTLEAVLSSATHMSVAEFAQQRLFEPLGMAHTHMSLDGAGNTVLYQGTQSSCEDLARFGLLLLNGGRWGSEQIVSADYVAEATGRSSTKLNVGYGFLFWLNHRGPIGNPLVATDLSALSDPTTQVGQLAPGAPRDLFWAIGLGNQIIQVDPGSGTVVVRLGAGGVRPKPPTFGPVEASKVVTEAVR